MNEKGMQEAERERLLEALVKEPRTAELDPLDRAMLDYAIKLTDSPGAITAQDIHRLRAAGLDDRGVHDLCSIAAYFAFVNRIADGLGVELEARFGELGGRSGA